MNIIYISALEGGKYSGPLYSVPRQIEAQSKYDNVLWINLTNIDLTRITCDVNCNYIEYKKFKIEELPDPFNKPDFVVFEEFFKIENALVARKLEKKNIPYIIIPRCQMTTQYLNNKKMKKKLASLLLFNRFAKNARTVQFLTEEECNDSRLYYNKKYFIVPNGIILPAQKATPGIKDNVIGTFIGRYSVVQKGLDILLEAIAGRKDVIQENKIIFELYGPDERTGSHKEIIQLVKKYGLDEIVHVNGPVFDSDKSSVLLNSDFFVHTSRFEGLPMAVLEALAYGLPCLVTDGSNLRTNIEGANAGWGASTDVIGVKKAIDDLIFTLDQLQVMSENARTLANKYGWASIAKETHSIYEELIR